MLDLFEWRNMGNQQRVKNNEPILEKCAGEMATMPGDEKRTRRPPRISVNNLMGPIVILFIGYITAVITLTLEKIIFHVMRCRINRAAV